LTLRLKISQTKELFHNESFSRIIELLRVSNGSCTFYNIESGVRWMLARCLVISHKGCHRPDADLLSKRSCVIILCNWYANNGMVLYSRVVVCRLRTVDEFVTFEGCMSR
jgi:hypothetical protein